jgi:4-hydroxy-tetrahydrodipicolinate synthase
MHAAAAARDYDRAAAIWARLRPLAVFLFRAPNRDYRARLKELLVMQGLFGSAAVRPPLLPIAEAERGELRRLAIRAGLVEELRARRAPG